MCITNQISKLAMKEWKNELNSNGMEVMRNPFVEAVRWITCTVKSLNKV